MTLEDDLRSALHHHAEQIEPSTDGLERIEARLAPRSALTQRPRLAPRLAAAAAVLIAVGFIGAFALRGSGDGDVDLATSTPSTRLPAAAVENDLPPLDDLDEADSVSSSSSSVTEGTPAYDNIPPAPPGVLGPRSATPEAAVESFLGLIQRSVIGDVDEEVGLVRQGDLVNLTRRTEAGSMVDVATFQIGSVQMSDGSTGFVVVQAISPRIVIESPTSRSTTSGSALSVSGQGEGFEANVNVQLYSSHDGVLLNQRPASAGNFGVLAPFSASLDVSGPGPAWIVVQSGGGEDTDLDPFSAIPIVIDAPLATPEFVVTGIPDDDPDGGLVFRSLPGTDGAELGVLPSGQRRIHKRAAFSAFVGDGEPIYLSDPPVGDFQEWWNIWLPEPLEDGRQWAWVNSAYLSTAAEIDAAADVAELEAIGQQFVAGLRGDDQAFAAMPWADSVDFGLSSDIGVTTGGKARLPEFWADTFTFTPPAALSGQLTGNLREVLSPTKTQPDAATAIAVQARPAQISPYPGVSEQLAERFPGAEVIQLTDPTNDGSGWRIVNLFVVDGQVRGMIAVEWTP